MDQPIGVPPASPQMASYKELLAEAGKQLTFRESLLFKRTALKITPALIFVFFVTLFKYKLAEAQNSPGTILLMVGAFLIVLILIAIYTFVIGSIFDVEKNIWIDSYFDGKNLEGKQSWRIARKLFWPATFFKLRLFFRYYLPPIIVLIFLYVLSVWVAFYFALGPGTISTGIYIGILICSPVLLVLLAWPYFYYLKVKLRYVWFLWLDSYGKEDFTYKKYFSDLGQLNKVSKQDAFMKTLVANLGADTINSLTKVTSNLMFSQLGRLGIVGEAAGNTLTSATTQISNELTSFAKIAAIYLLYRTARSVGGQTQQVNENIYNLAN